MNEEDRRHSVATEAYLIMDENDRAEAEARNGLVQFDQACHMIMDAIDKGSAWKLRLSMILGLHRAALGGISIYAGNFRPSDVAIQGSEHRPVDAHRVPELIEELCDYVNEDRHSSRILHHVASELDSSIQRWQRPYFANDFVSRAFRKIGYASAGSQYYSRPDCR